MARHNKNRRQSRPEYLVNNRIPFQKIRLIGKDREQLGIVDRKEALYQARRVELDLVIIAERADPPVARIINFDKFKYEQQKAKKEKEKKSRLSHIDIKEMQFRPGTHDHDIGTKAGKVKKFLEKGHKVKIVVKFRGRERAHKGQANEIIESVLNHMSPLEVKYDKPVDYRGHNVWCVLKV